MNDAVESLIKMGNTASEAVRADKLIADWLTGEFHWQYRLNRRQYPIPFTRIYAQMHVEAGNYWR